MKDRFDILIVGTGYIGSNLAIHCKTMGWQVAGITRSIQKAAELNHVGIHPIIVNITQTDSLIELPKAKYVVFCASPDKRKDKGYEEIYITGTNHVLASLKTKPDRILYVSSSGVWPENNGNWVDESIPALPKHKRNTILLEAEFQIKRAPHPYTILRLGGIYGPDRNRIQALAKSSWPTTDTDSYLNLIHRDDAVSAIFFLLQNETTNEIYAGVDDLPVKKSEFTKWLCEQLNLKDKTTINTSAISGKKVSNKKLKNKGFQFLYSSYQEGYKTLIKNEYQGS